MHVEKNVNVFEKLYSINALNALKIMSQLIVLNSAGMYPQIFSIGMYQNMCAHYLG